MAMKEGRSGKKADRSKKRRKLMEVRRVIDFEAVQHALATLHDLFKDRPDDQDIREYIDDDLAQRVAELAAEQGEFEGTAREEGIVYAVWVEVERIDEKHDRYETQDLPFASTAYFDTLDQAVRFARALHNSGESMNEWLAPRAS